MAFPTVPAAKGIENLSLMPALLSALIPPTGLKGIPGITGIPGALGMPGLDVLTSLALAAPGLKGITGGLPSTLALNRANKIPFGAVNVAPAAPFGVPAGAFKGMPFFGI